MKKINPSGILAEVTVEGYLKLKELRRPGEPV